MNILKLFLPKEKQQVVQELESWTVKWCVKTGWADADKVQFKVFIKEKEAKEFRNQLVKQAEFIGCYIKTEISKN